MKKTVLFAAALFAGTAASAQTGEITSNRGENWLSQDGDWGLTFSATPLLGYAGNLFNGTAGNNTGAGLDWATPFVIQGKKLVDANTAYRAQVRLGFGSNKVTNEVVDLNNANNMVEDVVKNSYNAINLGFGLEKRVGSTRIVGVYGAQLNVGLGGNKQTFEYGNTIVAGQVRQTEVKGGSTFNVGLSAFAGVEWFVAPKVSLSGEYQWGVRMASTGYGETTTEVGGGDGTTVNNGPKTSSFGIDTAISGANIGLNFYFQ